MKKYQKFLLPLVLLALTACTTNDTGSSSNSGSSVSSGGSSEPDIIEVTKKFELTTQAAEGSTITVSTTAENSEYEAGTLIEFSVTVDDANKELTSVLVNDKLIAPTSGNSYEFYMPNQDTTIKTEVLVLGDESVVTPSPVDAESVPETVQELYEVLKASKTAESLYLQNASYSSTFEESYESLDLVGTVYNNDVVFIDGRYLQYESSDMLFYLGYEKGIQEDRYYSVETSTRVTSLEQSGTLQTIVDDETQTLTNNQIKESDATIEASTVGFVDRLLELTFSETDSNSFLSTNSYGWVDITMSTTTDSSNLFYTATVNAVYNYSSSRNYMVSLDVVIDGDNFVKSADFSYEQYAEDDWDSENNVAYDDAEPTAVQSIEIVQERNYRHTANQKLDLTQHVMNNYDVVTSYQLTGQSTVVATDNVVENSGRLTFAYRQTDNKPVMFEPTLVGAKEDGFITFDEDDVYVNQEGTFTLLFDNGLGEIKEVSLTSVQPAPYSITATLPGNIVYNGETNILTVAISPAGADQSATVTKNESSTGDVTIQDNQDGTFTLTGVTNGSVTLDVASIVNPEIKTSITISVENVPNRENIISFLTTTTLHGEVSGWGSHYVNFNSDGSGQYVCYEGSKGEVVAFTWELTEAFQIEITVDGDGVSGYYTLEGFENVSETSLTLIYSYYGSNKEATLTATDSKLDLSTAELS
ncbi:unknown [Firmicutes bacterium CAG:631]|nr:unknown [Firmicutes bacterium CAG:631]